MLEQYGVDATDRSIAMSMKLPYLFSYRDGVYMAGPMLQSADTELQLKSLEKILIARRARSSYETCFVIFFLINHKTGSAVRRCLPD